MAKTSLQFITIGEIGGDREDAESLTLPDVFSVDGSRNVYCDKTGRATSVQGYAKQNTAAVTAIVDGSAQRLRALYNYGAQPIGVVQRKLLGIFEGASTFDLRYSTDNGINWTAVSALGANYVDHLPDFAQLGDECLMTFGFGPVKKFTSGAVLSDATYTQMAAPSATVTTTIGLLDGSYRWKVVVVKADGSRKVASLASVAVGANKKQVTVTWTADADAQVYEVYRTTGTGAVYFFETAIPTGTLTYTSNVADLQLIAGRVLQEYGDQPISGLRYVEAHTGRVWYLGTDLYPRRAWYSDPGLPYSVAADSNFFDCTDDESFTDVGTGMTGNYKGMIVIWLERSVWTISGKGRYSGVIIDYERRRTDAQMGTVSHKTVARVPAGSVFTDAQGRTVQTRDVTLAYLTPLGDVRIFDGNNDTIISWPKKDTFKRLAQGARAKSFVLTDVEQGEITWVFPVDNATEPNYAVSWNLRTGQMVERQWAFACGTVVSSTLDASILVAGESSTSVGAFCYQLNSGYTFNGTDISARVTTKTLYGRDRNGNELMQVLKRWRYAELLVKHIGGATPTFTLEFWPTETAMTDTPWGTVALTFDTTPLLSADGSALYTADLSPIVVSVAKQIFKAQLKAKSAATDVGKWLMSRGVRLRLTASGSGQWALVGMRIAFQIDAGSVKTRFRR